MNDQSKVFPDCFYRVSVKGAYVVDGKILLARESDKLSGKWELPGGGLDFGEEPREALAREIKEEMGLTVIEVSPQPIYVWPHYFAGGRGMEWFYSMVMVYKIELEDLNFIVSDECVELGLYSETELKEVDIYEQAKNLIDLYKSEDFA